MLSLLKWDNNNKVNNWISTGISSEKIKPFDSSLAPIMSDLANDRVSIKFNNIALVQIFLLLLYSNSFSIYTWFMN